MPTAKRKRRRLTAIALAAELHKLELQAVPLLVRWRAAFAGETNDLQDVEEDMADWGDEYDALKEIQAAQQEGV